MKEVGQQLAEHGRRKLGVECERAEGVKDERHRAQCVGDQQVFVDRGVFFAEQKITKRELMNQRRDEVKAVLGGIGAHIGAEVGAALFFCVVMNALVTHLVIL